jgi:malonyl CoA-acyl carrier protein transacylase
MALHSGTYIIHPAVEVTWILGVGVGDGIQNFTKPIITITDQEPAQIVSFLYSQSMSV